MGKGGDVCQRVQISVIRWITSGDLIMYSNYSGNTVSYTWKLLSK